MDRPSITVTTDFRIEEYESNNHTLIHEIEELSSSIHSSDLEGLGTLRDYEIVFKRATEVKEYLESLALHPLPGLTELTESVLTVTREIESFKFDFDVSVEVDDTQILLQLRTFLRAFHAMTDVIRKINLTVHMHGRIGLPDSLRDIQMLVAQLSPIIDCAKATIQRNADSGEMSPGVKCAIQELNEVIANAEEQLVMQHVVECSSVEHQHWHGWRLSVTIGFPLIIIIALIIVFVIYRRTARLKKSANLSISLERHDQSNR